MFVDRSRFIEVAGVLRELQLCLGSQGNRRRFLYSWFEDEGVEMSSFPHHSMRSLERFAQGVRSSIFVRWVVLIAAFALGIFLCVNSRYTSVVPYVLSLRRHRPVCIRDPFEFPST